MANEAKAVEVETIESLMGQYEELRDLMDGMADYGRYAMYDPDLAGRHYSYEKEANKVWDKIQKLKAEARKAPR